MGVLPCYRDGCHNIMCDLYSDEYGYICWECFRELENSQTTDIAAFMGQTKRTGPTIDYSKIFKNRWDPDD